MSKKPAYIRLYIMFTSSHIMFPAQLIYYYNVSHAGPDYESYRVLVEGAAAHSVTDDPYEFIYQNLPQRQVEKCP